MNAHPLLHGRPREDEADSPPAQASPLTLLACAALVAVCSAGAVILALPHVVDAGAGPAAGARAVAPSESREAPHPDPDPQQATMRWVDTLEPSQLAQWRRRVSD